MGYGSNDGNWEEDTQSYFLRCLRDIKKIANYSIISEKAKIVKVKERIELCEQEISKMTRNGHWTPQEYKI